MKKSTIKKALKIQRVFSTIYFIVYAMKTFIIWKFENPFKWILEMGSYDRDARFGILICVIFLYAIICVGCEMTEDKKNKEVKSVS